MITGFTIMIALSQLNKVCLIFQIVNPTFCFIGLAMVRIKYFLQ